MGATSEDIAFTMATCQKDVHYAKAAIASVRHYYPNNPLYVFCDSDVPSSDRKQMSQTPNTHVMTVEELAKKTGLSLTGLLTKLYLLVLPEIRQTVFLDADSVLVGPVLDAISSERPFVPFVASWKDPQEPKQRSMFSEWAFNLDRIKDIAPDYKIPGKLLWLQSCNFFVDTDRFPIADLYEMLPHLNPQRGSTDVIRHGDQGFWNYVVNKEFIGEDWLEPFNCVLSSTSECLEKSPLTMADVQAGTTNQSYFIHYIGATRRYWPQQHFYGDILDHFNQRYYSHLSRGARWRDEARRLTQVGGRAVAFGIRRLRRKG